MASIETGSRCAEEWSAQFWEKGFAPWHCQEPHPFIVEHFPKVTHNQQNLKVFVPMCGKAVEMKWLADAGHQVVGVEGVDIALQEFLREQDLSFDVEEALVGGRKAKVYKVRERPIKLYCCDMLDFSREEEGIFDVVWDRGAFEAINMSDRNSYANIILDVLKRDKGVHLICVSDYDPAWNPQNESPYPVSDEMVKKYFGDRCSVVKLGSMKTSFSQCKPPFFPEGAENGEKLYLLTSYA